MIIAGRSIQEQEKEADNDHKRFEAVSYLKVMHLGTPENL